MRVMRRRQLLKEAGRRLMGMGVLGGPLLGWLQLAWGEAKRTVLSPGTSRESLIQRNPAELDARNLEITPLDSFGVMGLSDHQVDLVQWVLDVDGHVESPIRLSYAELRALPSVEREVLLICPGVFANQGRWKGVSIRLLLEKAQAREGVSHVQIRGPETSHAKTVSCPIADVRSDRVFLAYEVNGQPLPVRHGYPLRLVAEGYYGYDWVKYVSMLTAENHPQN
jgi:DMSO/TMAO reductase YedYZ molybdopterin-dependent catalytic subunit